MLTIKGKGEIGQSIISFCNWKNSFQVDLDAIKNIKENTISSDFQAKL